MNIKPDTQLPNADHIVKFAQESRYETRFTDNLKHVIEGFALTYAAQEVAKATAWQPIETAPRKTLVVGWYESVFTIACSRDGNGCQSDNQIVWMEKQASPKYNSKDIWLVKGFDKEGKRIEIKPTHYRPDVPPPPKPITK